MFFNPSLIITSLYGLGIEPDPELVKIREDKVKQSIQQMGDKYLLAKPVERLNERQEKN